MKKKVLSIVLAASMAAALTGCGGSSEETKAAETTAAKAETTAAAEGSESEAASLGNFEGQELSVSTFSFNAELLQKNVYDPFMEATGCKLIVEGGKNAERVTKIKETPENYDVVIIGDAFVADLIDADLLEKTDYSALTNRDALYDNAKAPFGEEYGPAYTFNRLGIVYDKATCPIEITSWADLWNPELEDSIAIPDITTTSGPLFYYAVAEMAGLTPGTDDDAIFAKMEELKPISSHTFKRPARVGLIPTFLTRISESGTKSPAAIK